MFRGRRILFRGGRILFRGKHGLLFTLISDRRGGGAIFVCLFYSYTVCPGSSDPFYIVIYYIKWSLLPGHTVRSVLNQKSQSDRTFERYKTIKNKLNLLFSSFTNLDCDEKIMIRIQIFHKSQPGFGSRGNKNHNSQ